MKHEACKTCIASVGKINIYGNILMIVLKGYLGVVGGSKGLIADAIHSCADLLATIVMIIRLKISSRETNSRFPYGYGKAEHIVAIIIYIFLFIIAGYIIYEGVLKKPPRPFSTGEGSWAASKTRRIYGLALKLMVAP